MKTKQIKGKVDILLVDGVIAKGGGIKHKGELYKFLSTIENLTEEQAAGLVNRMQPHVTLFGDFYENYIDSELMYESPISSFHSLLKANDAGDFNPKTTLIFVKM